MGRFTEKVEDAGQYVVAVPLSVTVSAVTAAVMAIGFGIITAIERLTHH